MTDHIANNSSLMETLGISFSAIPQDYTIPELKLLIKETQLKLIKHICDKNVKGRDAAYIYATFFDHILQTIFKKHFSKDLKK